MYQSNLFKDLVSQKKKKKQERNLTPETEK